MNYQKIKKLNEEVFEASQGLRLLGTISWPAEAQKLFLESYKKGDPIFPDIHYPIVNMEEQKHKLIKIKESFTPEHPLEVFTFKTLCSFLDGIYLAESVGTEKFTEHSIRIFGKPTDAILNSPLSNLGAAESIISLADDFNHSYVKENKTPVDANEIKKYLDLRIDKVFKGQGPEVVITENLSAKATATSKRIKLRSGLHFNHYDFKQLFYHEVMTHALTAINGESQELLKCMARGSLRTLKTQEGLATFSEIITGAIDLHRLKRLALRVIAIDKALKGANFVDIFEFFLKHGQSEEESYLSSQRVFRGGYPNKNIVFTKDCIYLDGLMDVHALFRWAMKNNRLDMSHLLFCGRLSLDDLTLLEPSYRDGHINPPRFLPAWYTKVEGLAGALSFSILTQIMEQNTSLVAKVKAA